MRKKYWTEDKIQFIKDNVCSMTEFQLAKHFHCTVHAIQNVMYSNNIQRNFTVRAQLKDEDVRNIRKLNHLSYKQIAEMYKVSYHTIYDVITNKTYRHVS